MRPGERIREETPGSKRRNRSKQQAQKEKQKQKKVSKKIEESKRQEQEARPGHGRMGVAHISELVSCSSRLPETEPIRPERREAK